MIPSNQKPDKKMRIIKPIKKVNGEITVPGDKSISHRALILGAIAEGVTNIKNILDCDDCNYTVKALKSAGIAVETRPGNTTVRGLGLYGLKKPADVINVGESGTSMRLLAGIFAAQRFDSALSGKDALNKRPMNRIIEPLSLMGAAINSAPGGYPPLAVKGSKLRPISYRMPIPSAQVKSAILLAGLYADGTTIVEENVISRDHTERALKYFGADIRAEALRIRIKGPGKLFAKDVEVPGDISSAAFIIALAVLIPGSSVRIKGVGVNPTRTGMLQVLSGMGANIKLAGRNDAFEPSADIIVESGHTKGVIIKKDMLPLLIDELPAVFVVAALSEGRTVIKGAEELRVKETDRIASMRENLNRMGARMKVEKSDIIIEGVRRLNGAGLKSFGDHRTCMAMSIAALAAEGESSMDDIECVNKSFPQFYAALERITC